MVPQRSNLKCISLEGKNGIQFGNVVWEREFAGALDSFSFPISWLLNFGQEVTLRYIL